MSDVRAVGLPYLKVFWPVVVPVVVDVMNALRLGEIATKGSLGHKAMLIDVTVGISARMIVNLNHDVSVDC
jgi:hypothetical protein